VAVPYSAAAFLASQSTDYSVLHTHPWDDAVAAPYVAAEGHTAEDQAAAAHDAWAVLDDGTEDTSPNWTSVAAAANSQYSPFPAIAPEEHDASVLVLRSFAASAQDGYSVLDDPALAVVFVVRLSDEVEAAAQVLVDAAVEAVDDVKWMKRKQTTYDVGVGVADETDTDFDGVVATDLACAVSPNCRSTDHLQFPCSLRC